ncbi:hypothetical protein [Pontibacter harenae]|uniref:hypothetical protein n=1 Tax=Pontibacter harenae TaxID=2894083 RepID=UPI001E5C7CB0|nr:hypothetical protein [Pontibacter harenae]MCC9167081.1 hypothetical protein [Pontibacter harenae]
MANKEVYENMDLKFDVYENSLVFKRNNNAYVIDPGLLESFTVAIPTGQAYTFTKAPEAVVAAEPKTAASFVAMLFEGQDVKLAFVPSKRLKKANYKVDRNSAGAGVYGSSSNDTFDEFLWENTYFVIKNNGKAEAVNKLNKKNLLNALSDKEKEVKSFISKEKVDANTEEGWKKTLEYYDSL